MSDSTSPLHQQAITAALSANWEEALKLNQLIIETDPNNTDVLNRLARAHFELGDLSQAKKFYKQSLENDPYNQIASKFLKRIETFSKSDIKIGSHAPHIQISTDYFIEEPGKTKLVSLIKVAEPQKLSLLSAGESVQLVAKNRFVTVTSMDNDYLGVIPDDLSHILLRLMKGGNKYSAFIKTIKTNSLTILIREVFRSVKFKNQPSFLENTGGSVNYSSDHIIISNEDMEMSSGDSEDEESI